MNFKVVLAGAAALLASAGSASASLIGDTVTVKYLFPDGATVAAQGDVLVGSGVEVSCPSSSSLCVLSNSTLDFGANSISFSQTRQSAGGYSAATFNGWEFSSLDFGGAITNVILTSFGITGLDASRVSWTASTIRINVQGLNVAASNGWNLQVQTAPLVTPVPAALPLLLTGIGGLAFASRRRRDKLA